MRADLITVFHNDINHAQHLQLRDAIATHEPGGGYRFIAIDNRSNNRGFAKACNLGAFHDAGKAPIIGFLNPDTIIDGPFLDRVQAALDDHTVITGCRFEKPDRELKIWGVNNWVCGAALFVQRAWFTSVGGFDEQFTWSHEETDLIRQAQTQGFQCQPINLPVRHQSPAVDDAQDARYKQFHFTRSAQRYFRKWGTT